MKQYCDKNIKMKPMVDLRIDDLANLPDYIATIREFEDPKTGRLINSMTKTPTARLIPNGNLDNIIGLEANNPAIEVPERQVRACYMSGDSVMKYTDNSHGAMFLAVGEAADLILCQNCGFVNLPKGHDYIIGVQYYAGNNGEPVTEILDGQKLFIPVSDTKLAINM